MSDTRKKLEARLRRAKTPYEKVDAMMALARHCRDSDEIERSIALGEQARSIAADIGYGEGTAWVLENRGVIRLYQGDIAGALETLHAALHLFEEEEDERGITSLRIRIGYCLAELGDCSEALRYADQGLRQARRLGDADEQLNALAALGSAYLHLGFPEKTLSHMLAALKIIDERGNESKRPASLRMIVSAYLQLEDYPNALSVCEQLLEISRRDARRGFMEQRTLRDIGDIHTSLCDYPKALEYYLQALEIADETGDANGAAMILGSMSIVYMTIEDYGKALELLHRSESMIGPDSANRAGVSFLLAQVHASMGNTAEALRCCSESLAVFSRGDGYEFGRKPGCLKLMGDLTRRLGDDPAAEGYYREALELALEFNDRDLAAECHLALGILFRDRNDLAEAIERFDMVVDLAGQIGQGITLRDAHSALYQAYEQRGGPGDIERAFDHFKRASRLGEEILGAEKQRRISTLETRVQIEQARREREILRLRNEKLELDMEHKLQELNAMAVHLTQKSELVREIRKDLKDHGNEEGLNEVLARIEKDIHAESDWEIFESRLEEVHRGFLARLSRQFPMLTPSELKVCALLKTQIPSKEIAGLLAVTPRAVEKHRWNIRRKLGLTGDVNLVSYLAAL
jgi:tetratricopeptide (TPR) repeat protein/DNA-binding CsgD family transcriptional regulator